MEHPDVKRTHCSYVLYFSCIMVLCIPQYFAHLYMHYALHTITCTTTPADDLALAICAGESLGAGFRSSLQAFESWWTQILYIWKRLYVFGSTCFYQSLNVNCNPSHADSCPSWRQKAWITKFLPLTPLASMKPQTAHPKRVVIHT